MSKHIIYPNLPRIDWDEQKLFFVVKTPVWFKPESNNSITNWIIFYLEISLWVHYYAYVKSRFRNTKETLNPKIFISKEGQLINVRNELSKQWMQITEKQKVNENTIKELGNDIMQAYMKMNNLQ